MSRYGVYPGNTSASTSTTDDTITDGEEDSEDYSTEADHGLQDSLPGGGVRAAPDPGVCNDDSTAKPSTTNASTPVFEFPSPVDPMEPMDPLIVASLRSGQSLNSLEKFLVNAMIEKFCYSKAEAVLSPNLPHHIHEAYKKDLFRRTMNTLGMSGGFDREEFKAVRESVFDGISAVIHNEMLNMLQQAPLSPPMQYTPGRQNDLESTGLEVPEGHEVVRMIHRPQSSENLAPLNFIQANRRLATGLDRPATSDGRKMGAMPGPSRSGGGSNLKDKRRPELMRAMSFDHLNRAVGGGPKTPPLIPPKLSRGTTSYTSGTRTPGYRTPQPRTPNVPSHPFKLHSFGPAPPPSSRERDPTFVPPHNRPHAARIPPHISNMSAIRASVSLQQQTVQGIPMERSWSVDRALSLFHPQAQNPAQHPKNPLERFAVSQTSRYKTDFAELAFLGKGGFASVYKVRNILDGREYAIKKVPIRNRHLNGKGDRLDAIFREIKTLAKLEHNNVVRYYSAWVESANGLWDKPVAKSWSQLVPEVDAKAVLSPRIGSLSDNMTLGYGVSPDEASGKDGAILSEFPILGGAAFIDDKELNDPNKFNFSNAAEDDSMGIQFGDDTTKNSDSPQSPRSPSTAIPDNLESSSSDESNSIDEDVASDIEVIPRLPPQPTQIPLPVSPQYPVEYFRQRRRSFVSLADEDGNELPYIESYARGSESHSPMSGNDNRLGQAASPQFRDKFVEIKEALQREKEKTLDRQDAVFENDEDSSGSEEDETGELSNVSMHHTGKKSTGNTKGKSAANAMHSKQVALVNADRLARKEADRKEILTLMILMSVHPLTLKEFLWHDSESSSPSNKKNQFSLPRGLAIYLENSHQDSTKQQDIYCWHMKCALKLFKGVLKGVEYLHSKGIVHRDLKPGNIFLNIDLHENIFKTNDGPEERLGCRYCDEKCGLVPRIGDFGLVADLVDGVRRKSEGCDDTTTEADADILRGDVVGTALYRPPPSTDHDEEELGGSGSDDPQMFGYPPRLSGAAIRSARKRNIICEKTDVYALGIILFELLYRCGTGSERVRCLIDLRDERKLPVDWKEKVSQGGVLKEEVVDVVGKCVMGMTEKKRASRWNVEQVKKGLKGLPGWE